MSKKIFDLGFIGGGIGSAIGYTHFIASQMDHRFKIKAGCFSQNQTNNLKTAQLWGDEDLKLYNDWESLLEKQKDNLDAICVLTPTPTHKQIVSKALKLKYAVICEKTLCMNSNEALEIKNIVEETNGFLAITYNYTGYHMLRELKAMIKNKDFGRIHNIQIEMPQEGFICSNNAKKPNPQKWRMSDFHIPIISLDLGVHCQNMIYFLIGKYPKSVVSSIKSNGYFKHIADDVNILALYGDNLTVNMWYSKSAIGYRNGLKVRIYGNKMSACWLQTNPEELFLNTAQGEKIIKDRASPLNQNIGNLLRYNRFKAGHPSGFIEAFGNYYSDIADTLKNFLKTKKFSSDYVFGIKEALKELKFFEAVSKSEKTKKFEKIKI